MKSILFFANNTISKPYTTLLLELESRDFKVGVICIGRPRKRYYDQYFNSANVYDILRANKGDVSDISPLGKISLDSLLGDRRWVIEGKVRGNIEVLGYELFRLREFYVSFKPTLIIGENASVYSEYISKLDFHKKFITFYHGIAMDQNKMYFSVCGKANPQDCTDVHPYENELIEEIEYIESDRVVSNKFYMRKGFLKFWMLDSLDFRSVYHDGIVKYSIQQIRNRINRCIYLVIDKGLSKKIDKTYALYYLQFDEDLSLLRWSKIQNQLSLLRALSKELKTRNVKLVVKEHPFAVGTRNLSYYCRLLSISNLRLVRLNTDRSLLLNNSKGVITITGTIGREALMQGKKVVAFGNPYYNAGNLLRTRSVEEAADYICGNDKISIEESSIKFLGLSHINGRMENFVLGKVPLTMIKLMEDIING